jgi:Carboxypeptidase regulatory-like domain
VDLRVDVPRPGSRACWLSLLLLLSACVAAHPQSDTGGTIAGLVKDGGGRLFPAMITVRNTANGAQLQVLSDRKGNFRFPEVHPGLYTVRVNAPGFAPWRATNVTVEVGRVTVLTVKMEFSIAPRSKPPNGLLPQNSASPAVSSNFDPGQTQDLPNSTSEWSQLVATTSGVVPDGSPDNALSFRGLSPLLNGISLDGTENNLAFHANQRGSRGSGYATSRLAVSEFQVNASNFSAEYGRAAGGEINSVTKSGGNRLHGQAVFYDRDAAWGSTNAFSKILQPEPAGTTTTTTGQPILYLDGKPVTYVDTPYKAPDQRLQWGASAGGPIRQNKLFWFLAYDQHNRDFPGVARANEPDVFFAPPTTQALTTLGARITSSTSQIVSTCRGTVVAGDQAGLASCAYDTVLGQLNGLLGSVPRTSHQLILFPKIEWQPNTRIHLIGEFNHMRRTTTNGVLYGATETDGIGSFGDSATSEDAAIARLEYFITPNLLSNARYQYSRDALSQTASTATDFERQFADNSYGLAPQISIDRTSGFTFGTLGSLNKPQYPEETRQQFADAITWIHRRHAIKFGYDYNHVTDAISGLNNQTGAYSYATLLDFVSDMLAPDSCDGTTTGAGSYPCYSHFQQAVGPSVWQFNTEDYAAFLADEWKISHRFTISLGMRYEFEDLPDTSKSVANPDIPQTAYLPRDRNNYGPRAGFSWDLFGSGKTVLRAGYGIYYGRIANATVFNALTSTGSARSARTYYYRPLDTGAPPFPHVFASNETPYVSPTATGQNATGPNAVYFDKRFQNPQIDEAELSLQHEFWRHTEVSVSYLGSYAHQLPQFIDRNIDLNATATMFYSVIDPGSPNNLGPLQKSTAKSGGVTTPYYTINRFYYQRLNPKYGSITDIISETNAAYHAAVLRITRRAARGLTINAGYTWSHAIDDNQNESTFAGRNDVYDPADLSLERGASNFDVRQRIAGGVVAHEPWRFRGMTGTILNGFTLAATGEWRSGLPYSMRTTGPVPTPSCSYYNWLVAGGPNGGGNCLKAVTQPNGVITDERVPIPGLGASLNGSGGEDLIAPVGRNTFRYPNVTNLDVRFAKSTRLRERVSLELIGEAFNVMNHQNATAIQTVGYRVTNDPAHANMGTLSYQGGLTTAGTTTASGATAVETVPSATAAFGGVTNANSSAFYHQRQIQLGIKLIF